MTTPATKMTRIEWGVILALISSAGSVIYTVGYMSGTVATTERRVTVLEGKVDAQAIIVTRIDANVTFLADRAREDRAIREMKDEK